MKLLVALMSIQRGLDSDPSEILPGGMWKTKNADADTLIQMGAAREATESEIQAHADADGDKDTAGPSEARLALEARALELGLPPMVGALDSDLETQITEAEEVLREKQERDREASEQRAALEARAAELNVDFATGELTDDELQDRITEAENASSASQNGTTAVALTREQMEARAAELNVTFSKNLGDAKLAERIAEAEAKAKDDESLV